MVCEGTLIVALFWWLLRGVVCMFYGVGEMFVVRVENVSGEGVV